MNILIVSAVFPPEPVVSAKISYQLANKLAENNNVVVLSPKPTRPKGKSFENSENCFKENFSIVRLDSYTCPESSFIGRMKESISFGKVTLRYINENANKIGCIYVNTWPMFAQYITIRAANKNNIPIVLHIQDIYPESMLPRLGFLGKIIGIPLKFVDSFYLNRCSSIVAISDHMKKFLIIKRKLEDRKIEIVRNWQSESDFDKFKDLKKENNIFTFMFVGSISPAAGVYFILKSFIEANLSNTRLIIAGDGSDKVNCLNLVSLSKAESKVEFISASPHDVPSIQSKADCLLLPLKKGIGKTASPSKLPAYMFSSKPIIASVDKGSDSEYIIKKAKCGLVCEPEDKVGFIDSLISMKKISEEDRLNMGNNGRQYALQNMSTANCIKLANEIIKYDSNKKSN